MMYWYPYGGWWMMVFGFLFWIAVIIGIIYLILYMQREQTRHNTDEPLTLLKRRYVRGEITKKEYETMKKEL